MRRQYFSNSLGGVTPCQKRVLTRLSCRPPRRVLLNVTITCLQKGDMGTPGPPSPSYALAYMSLKDFWCLKLMNNIIFLLTEWESRTGRYLAWGHDVQTKRSEVPALLILRATLWTNFSGDFKYRNWCKSLPQTSAKDKLTFVLIRQRGFIYRSKQLSVSQLDWEKFPQLCFMEYKHTSLARTQRDYKWVSRNRPLRCVNIVTGLRGWGE